MKEFTFAIITYNQQNYIIETLESMKQVIKSFGNNYRIDFLLCDDCSKDNTVSLSEKWINQNINLFDNVKVISAKENHGIVKNYLSAIENIKTEKFKIIAGDDIFLPVDIFAISEIDDFVLTPVIRFSGTKVKKHNYRVLFKEYICCPKDKIKKYIANKLKYNMCIDTPGMLWCMSLFDDNIRETLQNYNWIEDVPLLSYIFNKDSSGITVYTTPIVAYRDDVGISTNNKHSKRKELSDEEKIIFEKYFTNYRKCKLLNPYSYKSALQKKYIELFKKNDPSVIEFDRKIEIAENETDEYLKNIHYLAHNWIKNNI